MRANPEFVFIDKDCSRIKNLRSEIKLQPWHEDYIIQTICGEFSQEFPIILDTLVKTHQPSPLFVFIDPFGFSGVPFKLVKRVFSYKRAEVFILLDTARLRRFLGHPNNSTRKHMEELFGTKDVFTIAKSGHDRISALRGLYQQQLSTCVRFVRFFEMLDRNDVDIYHLFFATNSPLGFERMKEAMWAVDETGTFRFSDRTDPGQMVMIGATPNKGLAEQIEKRFAERTVCVREIKQWVIEETTYLPKHVRAALKHAERTGRINVKARMDDGSKRRSGAFPDGVIIDVRPKPMQKSLGLS